MISVCERVDLQNVDNCEKVKLQDVATVVTNEQVIEQEKLSIDNTDDEVNSYQEIYTNKVVTEVEVHIQPDVYWLVVEIDTYVPEEVVSDITWLEVYKVDVEIHTYMQLDKQVILPPAIYSSEEKGGTQSQPKLVKNMSSLPDKPIPALAQDAQPKVVPQISSSEISLLKGSTQDKLITTTHESFEEIAKCKALNREGMWGIIEEIPTYINPVYRPSPRTLTYKMSMERVYGASVKKVTLCRTSL